jgi:hypothetical protein
MRFHLFVLFECRATVVKDVHHSLRSMMTRDDGLFDCIFIPEM